MVSWLIHILHFKWPIKFFYVEGLMQTPKIPTEFDRIFMRIIEKKNLEGQKRVIKNISLP